MSAPMETGARLKDAIGNICCSLLFPYGRMLISIIKISRCARLRKTELEQALQSRAVCVLVKFSNGKVVAPSALKGLEHCKIQYQYPHL
jgi:hypothetical protein